MATPIAKPRAELTGLVRASYPRTRFSDMVLSSDVAIQLEDIVHQQRQRDRLREHGLEPIRKILLVGPPGCGKSMTAAAVAGECRLPLLYVQLHTLVSRYLGETAAKLHQVFEAMEETQGVYFFDEFDAIGATRQSTNDVGEMRRVLNTFLQLVEHDSSDSVLIAATNLGKLLDPALFRRFDRVVQYTLPDTAALRELIENHLASMLPQKAVTKDLLATANGLSHAEVVRACDDAARSTVLDDGKQVSTAFLMRAIRSRKAMQVGA